VTVTAQLAFSVPVITSITPAKTAANSGETVSIFGTGFGNLADLIYFPDGTGGHVVTPNGVIPGGVTVVVPPTWSGGVTVQAGGVGVQSNAVVHDISFSYQGNPWPSFPFAWKLNSAGAPGCTYAETRDALVSGYQTWACASGMSANYSGSSTANVTAQDGQNLRMWRNTGWSPGTVAVANWWIVGGSIVEADITFNSQHFTWSCSGAATDMDVQNVGTHEEGHTIGLLDLYGGSDFPKTMYGVTGVGETLRRSLDLDDVLGAEFMYPHVRANLTGGTPVGWGAEIVARNTADATASFAPVPATLNGNTLTYLSGAGVNSGGDCVLSGGVNELFLDDVSLGTNAWTSSWNPGIFLTQLNTPTFVRGGRHTVRLDLDINNDVIESSEIDNSGQVQYVWSPQALANEAFMLRNVPPVRGAGLYPNSDGFSFTTGGTWWGCAGILPVDPADDYDIRIHSEAPTSTAGFATYQSLSGSGAGTCDFVIVNGNNAGGANVTRWAGVTHFNGGASGFYVEASQNRGTAPLPGNTGTALIDSYHILAMQEVHFSTAGNYMFLLNNIAGNGDLGFALYDAAGIHFAKTDNIALADANGAGQNERFTVAIPTAGYYGMVVYKSRSAELAKSCSYSVDVVVTPGNLTPQAGTGWDGALVLRNDAAAVAGSVHHSALTGNANTTYLNLAGINNGAQSIAFNHTRLYFDGVFAQWVDWGAIAAGSRYTYLNDGPFIVRGGRHMVAWKNDWNNEVAEVDETDNDIIQQFVWRPYNLLNQTPVSRIGPPSRGATAGFAYPNCDGLQFGWNHYWSAVGMLPDSSGVDNDLRLYNQPVGVLIGFGAFDVESRLSGDLCDYVLVNGNRSGGITGTRQVGVVRSVLGGRSSSLVIEQADAAATLTPPDTSLTATIGSGEILQVLEVYFGPSDLKMFYFYLTPLGGNANLNFDLFDQAGAVFQPTDAMAVGNSAPGGVSESIRYHITEPGYYGLVIYKNSAADLRKSATYRVEIRLLPNLYATADTGWDDAIVPRNDNTATSGNVLISPILDGNALTTYVSVSGKNSGDGQALINHTRLYLDGQAMWSADWGALGARQFYSALNLGPLAARGGRHTLLWRNDWDHLVTEASEFDNDYFRQFIWSPLALATGLPVVRPAAPERGSGPKPNCDGFSYLIPAGYAWVVAGCPTAAADDYDLASYANYYDSTSGFISPLRTSSRAAGLVDFVGGSSDVSGTSVYPGIIGSFAGGTNDYVIEAVSSGAAHVAAAAPASWPHETLPAGHLVDVFEASLNAGDNLYVRLDISAGAPDLALSVFEPAVQLYEPGLSLISWNSNGPGGAEGGIFTPAASGRYVFVVEKVGAADLPTDVTYSLSISAPLSGVQDQGPLPRAFSLRGNVPNPFNPATNISYEIPGPGTFVHLVIYDLKGRRVRNLVETDQVGGRYTQQWDGRNDAGQQMASGTYFYRLQAGPFRETRKMILLK